MRALAGRCGLGVGLEVALDALEGVHRWTRDGLLHRDHDRGRPFLVLLLRVGLRLHEVRDLCLF